MTSVILHIATKKTTHPGATVAGGWQFTIKRDGIVHEDVYSSPTTELALDIDTAGDYQASAYRVDDQGQILGNRVYAPFTITDVQIDTAAALRVAVG